jgi:hypothetical protein
MIIAHVNVEACGPDDRLFKSGFVKHKQSPMHRVVLPLAAVRECFHQVLSDQFKEDLASRSHLHFVQEGNLATCMWRLQNGKATDQFHPTRTDDYHTIYLQKIEVCELHVRIFIKNEIRKNIL